MRPAILGLSLGMAGVLALLAAEAPGQQQQRIVPPAIALGMPAACVPGQTCWILNYFNHGRADSPRDYRCGALTYDEHNGTDFALADMAAMNRGVQVFASAAGRVTFARDGMEDISFRDRSEDEIKGRACGNTVYLEHERGWLSQYCHMRNGSVLVKEGDAVQAGQPIGMIGMSGLSEFPHLHIGVKQGDTMYDPFVGPTNISNCGATAKPMWTPEVSNLLPYRRGVPYIGGITDTEPTDAAVRRGAVPQMQEISIDKDTFYVWADFLGLEAGDAITFRVFAPSGKSQFQATDYLPSNKARIFRGATIKRSGGAWEQGLYKAEIFVTPRGGSPAAHNVLRREVTLR
jgi:murein DD-endopeptidase MepM/ murein hydrolase activator NlpD